MINLSGIAERLRGEGKKDKLDLVHESLNQKRKDFLKEAEENPDVWKSYFSIEPQYFDDRFVLVEAKISYLLDSFINNDNVIIPPISQETDRHEVRGYDLGLHAVLDKKSIYSHLDEKGGRFHSDEKFASTDPFQPEMVTFLLLQRLNTRFAGELFGKIDPDLHQLAEQLVGRKNQSEEVLLYERESDELKLYLSTQALRVREENGPETFAIEYKMRLEYPKVSEKSKNDQGEGDVE